MLWDTSNKLVFRKHIMGYHISLVGFLLMSVLLALCVRKNDGDSFIHSFFNE